MISTSERTERYANIRDDPIQSDQSTVLDSPHALHLYLEFLLKVFQKFNLERALCLLVEQSPITLIGVVASIARAGTHEHPGDAFSSGQFRPTERTACQRCRSCQPLKGVDSVRLVCNHKRDFL